MKWTTIRTLTRKTERIRILAAGVAREGDGRAPKRGLPGGGQAGLRARSVSTQLLNSLSKA